MGKARCRSTTIISCIALIAVAGCAQAQAPSFVAFGAFFPAWMLCASVGILGAVGARGVLLSSRLSAVLPYPLLVCSATGLIIALFVWLLFFGQ